MRSTLAQVDRVVVGYDGSSAGELALDVAVAEARARRVPVHLVCVVELPVGFPVDVHAYHEAAVEALDVAAARAATELGADQVSHEVAVGAAGQELVRRCRPGDVLVVGTHGHRPVARMLLGSVSTAVVAHAPCPVQVVRGPRLRRPGPVVVGVDGSPVSQTALQWAVEAAAAYGTGVRAVLALSPVTDAAGTVTAPGQPQQATARQVLAHAVAEALEAHPGVRVEQVLALAHPVDALLRAGRDARLVVVGSRGLGGLHAMVIGSVSRELAHRADSPVTVVRAASVPAVPAVPVAG